MPNAFSRAVRMTRTRRPAVVPLGRGIPLPSLAALAVHPGGSHRGRVVGHTPPEAGDDGCLSEQTAAIKGRGIYNSTG